jgi:hypothetical protein
VLFPSSDTDIQNQNEAESIFATLDPVAEYSVFGEIQLEDRKLIGEFSHLTIEENTEKVTALSSRAPLRIEVGDKLYKQDMTALDDGKGFVATDESSIQLKGVRQTFGAGGTLITFDSPVPATSINFAYKARPLNGIWATAPYLHNGSVPNLDTLLKPPAQRNEKFRVGSREFDPVKVGFRTDEGDFEFDPTSPGNLSDGHKYQHEFTDTERKQLIEYLKSL